MCNEEHVPEGMQMALSLNYLPITSSPRRNTHWSRQSGCSQHHFVVFNALTWLFQCRSWSWRLKRTGNAILWSGPQQF